MQNCDTVRVQPSCSMHHERASVRAPVLAEVYRGHEIEQHEQPPALPPERDMVATRGTAPQHPAQSSRDTSLTSRSAGPLKEGSVVATKGRTGTQGPGRLTKASEWNAA